MRERVRAVRAPRPRRDVDLQLPEPTHPAAYRDEGDPDVDRERFELVLEGENLRTYRDVRRVLNRRPRGFWKAVGVDEWRSIGRENPCVVVEK